MTCGMVGLRGGFYRDSYGDGGLGLFFPSRSFLSIFWARKEGERRQDCGAPPRFLETKNWGFLLSGLSL
jgi:hypothetical protein